MAATQDVSYEGVPWWSKIPPVEGLQFVACMGQVETLFGRRANRRRSCRDCIPHPQRNHGCKNYELVVAELVRDGAQRTTLVNRQGVVERQHIHFIYALVAKPADPKQPIVKQHRDAFKREGLDRHYALMEEPYAGIREFYRGLGQED